MKLKVAINALSVVLILLIAYKEIVEHMSDLKTYDIIILVLFCLLSGSVVLYLIASIKRFFSRNEAFNDKFPNGRV
ncbi:MAG: hypothetical protein J0I41_03710 [Filimonas sp.]|nr:hypothetical protein [Filimonas sp.]